MGTYRNMATNPLTWGRKNKIYFRPDPQVNYYVAYQVPDWKRRYHVVANYSQGSISLIVNGENVVSNTVDSLDTEFSFSLTNSVFKTIGDDDYKVTVDAPCMDFPIILNCSALKAFITVGSNLSNPVGVESILLVSPDGPIDVVNTDFCNLT